MPMPFRSNRPARLEKIRQYDSSESPDSITTPPKIDYEDTNPRSPLRESVQVLTQRQIVRRQLLQREVSSDSTDSGDMRNKLTRTRSSPAIDNRSDATPSPSTVGNIVNNIESKIDIEQAINLLQELKKSASPEELVALHRALLPTKETSPTPSPVLPSIEEHAYTSIPPARKRSAIPPGLATRSGLSEDVLRRQYDTPTISRKSVQNQSNDWSFNTLRAQSANASPGRPFTPSGQQIHAGAFQHGSLRITNGAASPAPSIISKLAKEVDDAQTRSIFDVDLNDSTDDLASSGPTPPEHKEASRPIGPRPVSVDSQPKSKAKEQLLLDKPLQRHSFQPPVSRYSTSDEQPRFQQRIGHRATHISQEYITDCDITTSPYEEKSGLFDFAQRLSRVDDEEPGRENWKEQDGDLGVKEPSRPTDTMTNTQNAVEDHGRPQIEETRPTEEAPIDHIVRKKDSGYCSDIPSSPLQHKSEPAVEAAELDGPPVPPHRIQSREAAEQRDSRNDTSSLYTFEEFVGCSPRSDVMPDATPSPNNSPKKSPLSLFKSRSKKSGSFNVLNVEQGSARPIEALSRESSSQTLSGDGEKPKRKLQKAMPEAVRRQRKKTMENLRATQGDAQTGNDSPSNEDQHSAPTATTEFRLVPKAGESSEIEQPQQHPVRKRGKSFSRLRGKSVHEAKQESLPQSSLPARSRSKSLADAPIPIVFANDDADRSCIKRAPSRRGSSTSIHSDFNSVARALSSHPPTRENSVARTASMPRPKHKRYYSQYFTEAERPHTMPAPEIRSNAIESNDEDVSPDASPVEAEAPPQPQRAAPEPPRTPAPVGASQSVEDRFPGWQGKPASTVASNNISWGPPVPLPQSRHTVPEVVPPLPELPADIDVKVSKADQIVAKKLKISPRSSPNSSARSSIDTTERKQIAARRERDARRANEARQAALEQLSTPKEEPELKVERGEGQRWSMDGSIKLPRPDDEAQTSSPTHDLQHPGWPSWEQQATLWRKRREALALSIAPPKEDSPTPPEIKFTRYITPLGAQHSTTSDVEQIDAAQQLAQSYSDLIISDDNRPNIPRSDSAVSTATFVTMSTDNRPSKVDVPRTNSAISTMTSTTGITTWSDYSNPSSRSRQVKPYRPTYAIQAERSRALSLAKRRSGDEPARPEHVRNRSSDSLFDRYSGGLHYGWDKEEGMLRGSAGTGGRGKVREDLGLDLSDIPVFLQRSSFGRV